MTPTYPAGTDANGHITDSRISATIPPIAKKMIRTPFDLSDAVEVAMFSFVFKIDGRPYPASSVGETRWANACCAGGRGVGSGCVF
jgi:hypothetical protein